MSNYKKHIITGVIVSVILVITFIFGAGTNRITINDYLIMFFGTIYFSQFPDIDHKISNVTWTNILISIILLGLSIPYGKKYFLTGYTILITTYFATNFLPHRGLTHSIFFIILTTLLTSYINPFLGIATFVGMITHITLDKHATLFDFRLINPYKKSILRDLIN